jgi:hypothetical protein
MKYLLLFFLLLPLAAPLFAQQPVIAKSPKELKRAVGEFVTINENETLPERNYSVQTQHLPNGATGTFLKFDEPEKENGVKGKQPASAVKLSPNPVTDQLTVTVKNFTGETFQIEVLNLLGVELHSLQSAAALSKIDFTVYSPGIYFIRCTVNGERVVSRIVRQ